MVAEELALKLANEFSGPNFSVLDPFCGSGRLLLACAQRHPGRYIGFDVNPLAYLIASAKAARPEVDVLKGLCETCLAWRGRGGVPSINLKAKRKVEWFSEGVLGELAEIVAFINAAECSNDEKLILAVCLSGAARDASYCRMGGWKLHRLSDEARASHKTSAWKRFHARLKYAANNADHHVHDEAKFEFIIGDCRKASELSNAHPYDLIITSPPYGDSKSTVEYGAASGLCLDVVSNLNGFQGFFVPGCEIDSACLGSVKEISEALPVKEYWEGNAETPVGKKVARFLYDYFLSCQSLASLLKPGGHFVTVVGCRKAAGQPLRMDLFSSDVFTALGLEEVSQEERPLSWKKFPSRVNRYGGSASDDSRAGGVTATMEAEQILVFRRN